MPVKRSSKLGHNPTVSFANSMLEALARASGAGWFNAKQESRLRLIIREEFSDLSDEGLLFEDGHLDMLEAAEEASAWPNGDRPDLYDEDGPPDDEDEAVHVEVDEVEIIEPPTPSSGTKVMVIPCG